METHHIELLFSDGSTTYFWGFLGEKPDWTINRDFALQYQDEEEANADADILEKRHGYEAHVCSSERIG